MLLKIKIKRMKTSTNKDELKRGKLKNKRNVCGNNYTPFICTDVFTSNQY